MLGKQKMTPQQEVANALTMLLPSLVAASAAWTHWPHPWLTGLLIAATMHLPVSVAYHLVSMQRANPVLCRLDQTMLHVSGTLFAFVLSRGAWPYALVHACLTLHSVPKLWRQRRRRWPPVAVSVLLWLLPMAVSWRHFVVAALLFFVGAIGFVWNEPLFRGWGHALFHVATAGTMLVMCRFLCGSA